MRFLRFCLGIFLCLIGLIFIEGYGLSKSVQEQNRQMSDEKMGNEHAKKTTDCAVVLTGSAGRIKEGFRLLSTGETRRLIISGVHQTTRLQDLVVERPYLKSLNEQEVLLEKRSRTTYGNAQQALALVEAFRCQTVMLITSSIHMPRALRTFEAIFPTEIQILPRPLAISPSLSDLIEESMKSLFYRLLLWLDKINIL